jgi:hypothetical protein
MREGERGIHKFAPICYLLGVNGIRGQNIYPTTFAPHVWHLRGKFASFTHLPHHPNRPQVAVVRTSLGPLPRWVPGPTTRWAPRTTRLALHGTCWREAQGLQRRSTRIGSCTCPALYRGLLDVLNLYSLPEPTCNPASWTI